MKNNRVLVVSLILFVAVLIGVTLVEPVSVSYSWVKPFLPLIVITGFFVFLLSVGLFLYVVITNLRK